MSCKCADMPNCVNYGESEKEFVRTFELVDERPWLRLYRCLNCDTHWQLDVDDRSDFAIKVPKPDQWPNFDDKPYRREFFIRFHGGEGEAQCNWSGCHQRALKGMAICVDHTYPEFSSSYVQP